MAESLLARLRRDTQLRLSSEQADQAIRTIGEWRLDKPGGRLLRPLNGLRLLLLLVLLVGVFLAFRGDIERLTAEWRQQAEQRSAPEQFHPDGKRKTGYELWEDSLLCAYSADTGRCACYEPGGARVDIEAAACRTLAERGSVLRQ
jgi:hypothetical protein